VVILRVVALVLEQAAVPAAAVAQVVLRDTQAGLELLVKAATAAAVQLLAAVAAAAVLVRQERRLQLHQEPKVAMVQRHLFLVHL
jgi:hypothetical protein